MRGEDWATERFACQSNGKSRGRAPPKFKDFAYFREKFTEQVDAAVKQMALLVADTTAFADYRAFRDRTLRPTFRVDISVIRKGLEAMHTWPGWQDDIPQERQARMDDVYLEIDADGRFVVTDVWDATFKGIRSEVVKEADHLWDDNDIPERCWPQSLLDSPPIGEVECSYSGRGSIRDPRVPARLRWS